MPKRTIVSGVSNDCWKHSAWPVRSQRLVTLAYGALFRNPFTYLLTCLLNTSRINTYTIRQTIKQNRNIEKLHDCKWTKTCWQHDQHVYRFTGLVEKCPLLVSHFAVKVTARSRKWSLLPCNVNYKLLYTIQYSFIKWMTKRTKLHVMKYKI